MGAKSLAFWKRRLKAINLAKKSQSRLKSPKGDPFLFTAAEAEGDKDIQNLKEYQNCIICLKVMPTFLVVDFVFWWRCIGKGL